MSAAAATPRTRSSPGATTAVIALSGIVVSLMQTLVVPLLPKLPHLLGSSPSNVSWAVTATLLAAAVSTPLAGRLGDMYGKRRMILVSLAILVAGSLVCALTSSLVPVIVGRALQGAATGVIPLGISVLRDELPAERVGGAVALVSASLGVGGAVGLPLSAAVAQYADWHVLFWGSAGLGVVCGGLVTAVVRESPTRTPGRFDAVGALGLAAGLVCLLMAVSKGTDWGWSSATTLGLFAAGVVVLLAWAGYELRRPQPLIDLRVTARRPVLLTNLASVAAGFAMYGTSLVLPQLLQLPGSTGYGMGRSVLVAGLALAPSGLVMMALSPVSARISARWGPRTTLLAGTVVIAAGYVAGLGLMSAVWQIVLCAVLVSAGVGLAYAAMPSLIMAAVPVTETGAANGVNALMRSIGTSVSSAVMSAVLASMTVGSGAARFPSQGSFRVAFVIAAAASVGACVLTLFIPRPTTADASATRAGQEPPQPNRPESVHT